jgi:hypothetical protein
MDEWSWKNQGLYGVGMGLLGMAGGSQSARTQFNRQKELMALQQRNQQDLNIQGHQLQMDIWNKTNYGAQVDHMRDAGLNPALMYGSAGQGGQTGSQTGGAASMGNVQQMQMMDMQNLKIGAEIAAIKEGIEKSKFDRGVKGEGEVELLNAQARATNASAVLSELEGKAKKEYNDEYVQGLVAQWEKSGLDKDLQEIAVRLGDNGMHTPYIATIIGTLTGWNMTEEEVFEKEIGILPEGMKDMLNKVGLDIDPKITRRAAMNIVIGGIVAGKIGMGIFKDFKEIIFGRKGTEITGFGG